MDRSVFEAHGDDTAAGAVLIHHQIEREIFNEEFRRIAQRLAVKRVQHRMAGAVGRRAGALSGRAFTEVGRHASERALIDLAILGTRERYAVVLEFVNRGGRVAAEIFDRILITEPVGPFDRIVHVPAPVVRSHVAERRGNAALGSNRMRAGGKNFGDACGLEAGFGAAECGAKARAAGANDHNVISVIDDRIGRAVDFRRSRAVGLAACHWAHAPKLNFRIA